MKKPEQCSDGAEVFDDIWDALESSPQVAANLRVRSDFMLEIDRVIRENGWSEDEAARQCGVPPQRIRELLGNNINVFTVDELVSMTAALGRKVRVEIEAA